MLLLVTLINLNIDKPPRLVTALKVKFRAKGIFKKCVFMRCNWRNERPSLCLAMHIAWGCSALPGCTFPLLKLFLQPPWNSLQSQCLSHYKQSAEGLSVIPCIWPKMVFLGLRLHLIHHPGSQMMLGSFQKSDLFWEDKICQLWGFGGGGVNLRLWKPFPRESGVAWNDGHLVGTGAWPS